MAEASVKGDSEDYNRPRRPNADTLSYLRSLPLDEKSAEEEIFVYIDYQAKVREKGNAEEQAPEYPQSFLAALSAIDEIKNEIASLAGDEYGSQCIETLTRIGAKYSSLSARKLLYGLSGYHLHLATHRFGSHVMQTILQTAVTGSDAENGLDLETGDETEQSLPSLHDLLLGVVDELFPYVSQLAVHICGSHVLRTLLCVLGGVELVQPGHLSPGCSTVESGGFRRGKAKLKKKKKKSSDGVNTEEGKVGNNTGMQKMTYISNMRLEVKEKSIQEALNSLSDALVGVGQIREKSLFCKSPGELQQLACHPSAGPLLVVMVRVLTHSAADSTYPRKAYNQENNEIADYKLGISPLEPIFAPSSSAERAIKRVLCWDDNEVDANAQIHAGNVIYGLSGEMRGSHLLEMVLQTAHDDFYHRVCQAGGFFDGDAVREYASHDVSNFVTQTLLSTVRTSDQADELIKSLEPLIGNGYLLDLSKRRRGVLWRAVEMSAKFHIGQETILKSVRSGFGAIEKQSIEGSEKVDSNALETAQNDKSNLHDKAEKKKRRKKTVASVLSLEDCIPRLLDFKAPSSDGGRVGLDVPGTRAVCHMLRFTPRLCEEVLSGIVSRYSPQELEWIANDGLGSRCIFDGILDGPVEQQPFYGCVKQLLSKLAGKWVALSVERVGHHVVKKMFKSLKSMDDKASLVAELAQGINRLGGNAMGRSIMATCAVKEYMVDESAWRMIVKKQADEELFLRELVHNEKPSCEGRKLKRKKSKELAKGEGAKDVNGFKRDDVPPTNVVTEKASTVQSIMNTILIPSAKDEVDGAESIPAERKKRKRKRKANKNNKK